MSRSLSSSLLSPSRERTRTKEPEKRRNEPLCHGGFCHRRNQRLPPQSQPPPATTTVPALLLRWSRISLRGTTRPPAFTASVVFREVPGVKISVKVAGIHWHYGTRSHAPELTAGYYNTRRRDGYLPIARMLGRHGAVLNFTCMEMRDHEQPWDAQCGPEKLVRQVGMAAREAGVRLAGENALPRYDEAAHEQIVRTAVLGGSDGSGETMCAFTYLRMCPDLFQADNWRRFVAFVKKMREGREADRCREQVEREAERFVTATRPLVQEAAAALMSG